MTQTGLYSVECENENNLDRSVFVSDAWSATIQTGLCHCIPVCVTTDRSIFWSMCHGGVMAVKVFKLKSKWQLQSSPRALLALMLVRRSCWKISQTVGYVIGLARTHVTASAG
jgi:hypothetical protein